MKIIFNLPCHVTISVNSYQSVLLSILGSEAYSCSEHQSVQIFITGQSSESKCSATNENFAPTSITTTAPKLKQHHQSREIRIEEPEDGEKCCEMLYSGHDRAAVITYTRLNQSTFLNGQERGS